MRGSRWILVLAVVGSSLVAGPGARSAPGMEYIVKTKIVEAGKRTSKTVRCPASKSVIGGGVTIEGNNSFTHVGGSGPIDGSDADSQPDDGWKGTINNQTGEDREMTVIAVCEPVIKVAYRGRTLRVPKDSRSTAESICKSDEQLIGGGVIVQHGGDKNTVVYTGHNSGRSWLSTVASGAKAVTAKTWSLCVKGGTIQIVSDSDTLGAGVTERIALCPPVTVAVGGGARAQGGGGLSSSDDRLVSMFLYDGDADTNPIEGFSARFATNDAPQATVYAVCLTN